MNIDLYPTQPVLIVDDEEQTLRSCQIVLRTSGINNVIVRQDSREVLALVESEEIGAILLDLSMPYVRGEELLARLHPEFTEIPIIIITGANDVETAVQCMREGAFDYLVKPIEKERLVASVQRAIRFRELQGENVRLKRHLLSEELENPAAFEDILSQSPAMHSIFRYLESVAPTTQPVLITGETGTGKELMARAIHRLSGRKGAFVPINVAGLDDTMFSDALFGRKKGAHEGATQARKGLLEGATRGTLFVNEIGELELPSQVKLLRLLQEREYYPLGADMPKRSDARIVCASNHDLPKQVREGRFRKDLYFRLQTHHVNLPPLRERKEDIPLLVDHFLEQAARALGRKVPTPSKEIYTLLRTYHFPGNVRELESMAFEAVGKHRARMLSLDVFKERIFRETGRRVEAPGGEERGEEAALEFGEQLPTLKQSSQLLIREAMRRANQNQSIAARMLGITQQALSKRLKGQRSD